MYNIIIIIIIKYIKVKDLFINRNFLQVSKNSVKISLCGVIYTANFQKQQQQ